MIGKGDKQGKKKDLSTAGWAVDRSYRFKRSQTGEARLAVDIRHRAKPPRRLLPYRKEDDSRKGETCQGGSARIGA